MSVSAASIAAAAGATIEVIDTSSHSSSVADYLNNWLDVDPGVRPAAESTIIAPPDLDQDVVGGSPPLLLLLPPHVGTELLFVWVARARDLARIECALLRPQQHQQQQQQQQPAKQRRRFFLHASSAAPFTAAEIEWAEARGLAFRCYERAFKLTDPASGQSHQSGQRWVAATRVLHSNDGDRPADWSRTASANEYHIRFAWRRFSAEHRDNNDGGAAADARPAWIQRMRSGSFGVQGGLVEWRQVGKLHRAGGAPARVLAHSRHAGDGNVVEQSTFVWAVDGRACRPGGRPTAVNAPGRLEWHDAAGRLHRGGGRPASIDLQRGVSVWARHGKLHRGGGRPAYVSRNNVCDRFEWWEHGAPVKVTCELLATGQRSEIWLDAEGRMHRALPWPAWVQSTGRRDMFGMMRRWWPRFFWHGKEIRLLRSTRGATQVAMGCAHMALVHRILSADRTKHSAWCIIAMSALNLSAGVMALAMGLSDMYFSGETSSPPSPPPQPVLDAARFCTQLQL